MLHRKKKDKEQNNRTRGYPEDISNNINSSGSIFKCNNGHWYDGAEYNQCPHCDSQIVVEKKPKNIPKYEREYSSDITAEPITPSQIKLTPPDPFSKNGGNDTVGIFGDSVTTPSGQSEENTDDKSQQSQDDFHENEPESKPENKPSLSEAIKQASASSGEKTASYFSRVSSELSSSAKSGNVLVAEPVVGWLVCIKGCRIGESFSIFSGNNSIGRKNENRIIIPNDNNISNSQHAIIVYEPIKRDFFLRPGDSSGLTYLNGDCVLGPKKLKIYDIIGLGDSMFMFVPLCCEAFSWENFIEENKSV